MQHSFSTKTAQLARFVLCAALLTSTVACTGATSQSDGVSQAYNTSGVYEVPSYNRSIFSTTNF